MTVEDWLEIERLSEINAANNNIEKNGAENNQFAASLIKEIALSKSLQNNATNMTPRLNIGGFEVNSVEMSLALAHPIEFSWYTSISVDADDRADSIYTDNSNWYDGNGDAFRHLSWSALLYCKFYIENDNSKTEAEAHTYLWTNAHEGYDASQSPSPFDETLTLETRMDLFNNRNGILLGEIRVDMNSYDVETIFDRAEIWVDRGDALRIEEDSSGNRYLTETTNSEKRP